MAPRKKGKPLPPKPENLSDEQWQLANNVPQLLEVLAAGALHPRDAPPPLATKAQAALWLSSLAGSDAARRDEAFKAGAIELCARLASTASADAAVAAAALSVLAAVCRGSPQAREAVLAARPPVLASAHAALSGTHSSCAAGAAGACPSGPAADWTLEQHAAPSANSH
jgi:hypothetical protein